MTLLDIIQAFNKAFKNTFFVLHTAIIPNQNFKIYKTIIFRLCAIKDGKPTDVLIKEYSEKIPESNKQQIMTKIEKQFLVDLILFLNQYKEEQ